MAFLPPIPDRPADQPESWGEYLCRRATVSMHRQFADEPASWLKDAPPLTWREGSVRRVADPTATDLFFTDAGVLEVARLDIDLAPALKELVGQR